MAVKLAKTDVVVVGMGWAGGIIAAEASKAGLKVVGLERGKNRQTSDFAMAHDELRYERRKELMQDLSKETVTFRNNINMQALPMRKYGAFHLGDGVGGAGLHWNGCTHLFLDYDFQIYSKTVERYGKNKIPSDMTIQDWGITEAELDPYYQKFVQMAGVSGEPNHFRQKEWSYPTPPMKTTPKLDMIREAGNKLGLHPFATPSSNLSESYTNPDGVSRAGCQYCGYCELYGCEYGAKADPTVTVIPVAQQTGNFELRVHSQVLEVLHDGKKASGVRYLNTVTGEEYIQPAEIVVLSAYVFTNTKLLLVSKIGKPYDPKTGTGVVGKNYGDHLIPPAFGFFDDKEFNDYMGAGALGVSFDDFNGDFFDHSNLDFIHGGLISCPQTGIRPISHNLAPLGTPGWGKEFKKQTIHYFNRSVLVFGQGASLPHRFNYLDLDPVYKDAYGLPLVRITYDYSDNDRNLYRFLANKCADILKAAGASNIMSFDQLGQFNIAPYQSDHNVGGTPMGENPSVSVVNNYSQVWDMENLFVLGASTFANQSGYNPTGTLGALAYRAAEGLIKYSKSSGGMLV